MYGGEGEKTRDEMWQMERRNIDNNAGVSMDGVILAAAARGCMYAGGRMAVDLGALLGV